ncbi:MGMT family protein [Streptomyces sp. 7G]|uniref:methylated-DNA--[protein]-cysteine S-methyltransferase n=1 Tax=Streptomyces sp. 7G TaxID=2877241 RepID=UPI0027E1817A|nr:MGMT family protein [Streptomyces sp. 7G]
MTTTVYARVESPLGELLLVGEATAGGSCGVRLRSLSVPGQKGGVAVQDGWRYAPEAFTDVARQLEAYFAGRSTRFDVPLAEGVGTEFQRRVWAVLESIPYGSTVSYGEVAARVGASGAGVRARPRGPPAGGGPPPPGPAPQPAREAPQAPRAASAKRR